MTLSSFSPRAVAARHALVAEQPAPDFFQGALLGNGGLGAVVTTRPDSLLIHLGHNAVWDVRIAEEHKAEIGTFAEIFAKVQALPADLEHLDQDSWYRQYAAMCAENYAKSYPRPFPCGSLLLSFDRRDIDLLGHRLDLSTGVCHVRLQVNGQPHELRLFTEMGSDRLWIACFDADNRPAALPIRRVRLIPDPETPKEFPHYDASEPADGKLCFRQVLPKAVDGKPGAGDRAVRVTLAVSRQLKADRRIVPGTRILKWWPPDDQLPVTGALERFVVEADAPFVACLQLDHGAADRVTASFADLPAPTADHWQAARTAADPVWAEYWEKSGVQLDDPLLEETWYRNLYFFNCAVKAGEVCPGLFANWSYRKIGSDWHGDYHMNYNTQQPFWLCFASNHIDKHLPYVDLVDQMLPISRQWAREYYQLPGAYFMHSAYPVEMTMAPYPVPTWGWEICETPWTVQSLWWHWLYTRDREFMAHRAFGPIREAVQFLVAYMQRPEARGPGWHDDAYHVFPTVVPELYGLTPGFKMNADSLSDLTLIRFVYRAFIEACEILDQTAAEATLLAAVRDILAHFPAYAVKDTPHGPVFVAVPAEDPEIVYNCPVSTMTVFPGEEHGLHSLPAEREIAINSFRRQNNEGGNELVFLNMAGARLGVLDLEKFKRQIRYCTLPNGSATDMVLQFGCRYFDAMDYAFMGRSGVWFENFALPAVINECLLQSYTGVLRLFPNWPEGKAAEFRTLRAVGAFLVSARMEAQGVAWVEVLSETANTLRMLSPFTGGYSATQPVTPATDGVLEVALQAGSTVRFTRKG